MLYTFIVSISIPNCKSIAHFLSKMECFYLQKHTNYDVRFQSRFFFVISRGRTQKQMAPLDS